jgi:hypothetical protein
MDTLEFLRRVLPTEGHYCAGVAFTDQTGKQGIRQKFFGDVKDLADFLYLVSERDNNVYYGVASFSPDEEGKLRRKQNLVEKIKLLAIDIDVGKVRNTYQTRKDALVAVTDFVERAKLPDPVIVSSGMGFHCYWVLDRELTPAEWQPMADALKLCWQSHGLMADPTITADIARVLRPVGTKHTKSGKTVTLVRDAPSVSVEDVKAALTSYMTAAPAVPSYLQGRATSNIKLTTKVEHAPAVGFVVASKCKQIANAIKNPEKIDEPLWYAIMGVAAYTTDPEATAVQWSKGHPAYSEQDTLDKLAQWKASTTGPATCARFASLNPTGCNGCPYKGRVTSPTALGKSYAEAPIDVSAPDPVAQEIGIPSPYKRTASGIKYTFEDTDVDVCPFDLYPIGYGKDEALGYETVRYHWNRPHQGWTLLSFRQALLTDGHRDFATVMADNGIVLRSQKQTEDFRQMLRSYMDELRQRKAMSNLYTSMGWKENNTQFVLGDTVIRSENGTPIEEASSLSSHAGKGTGDMYAVGGTLAEWVNGTAVLEAAEMPAHMFSLNLGFAAPLFNFTGLKGLTVSLYGPTGGGKTLAQYFIQSIYGNPDKLHFAAKFTQNALFSRLGVYNNLPMTIDEATMMQDKDVGDFLYYVSQGKDKARLNRSADERDPKTWATPVIVSTNVSLQSKLVSSGIETDAQGARLLEVRIPAHSLFKKDTDAGQKLYAHLMSNYGYAGREFIKELLRLGEDNIRNMIEDARKKFGEKYGAHFSGEERYWETAIVLQDLAASIAARLGLIKYDYQLGTRWVLEQLGTMRNTAGENRADSFDLLSEYLNEIADCAVTVIHTGKNSMPDMSRCPRGEIRARFDVYRTTHSAAFDRGSLHLDRGHFRKWLSVRGADYKSLVTDLDVEKINVTPKSGRAMLGKDTPIKVGMMYVLGIDLTHPRLIGIMNDADEAIERIAATKLKVVDNVVKLGE